MAIPLLRATAAHAALLEEIHAQNFPDPDCWSADVFAAQMGLPGVFGLLAADQGFVLSRVAADEAEILTLCISPPHRRQGAARSLLSGAEKIAADWGASSMFLEVSVHNEPAAALYRGHGYERVGLRKRYYSDGSDGLILRKII